MTHSREMCCLTQEPIQHSHHRAGAAYLVPQCAGVHPDPACVRPFALHTQKKLDW